MFVYFRHAISKRLFTKSVLKNPKTDTSDHLTFNPFASVRSVCRSNAAGWSQRSSIGRVVMQMG